MRVEKRPLDSSKIKMMKPKDKDISDTGENSGLRVSCGNAGTKSFFIGIQARSQKN